MNKALATLLFVCCILKGAAAWHGNGHYMTAYIAQQWLLDNNFAALKWANDLLAPYTEVCGENLYPFVESATWLDKIKDQGWTTYNNHHFTENYWFDEGALVTNFTPALFANSTFGVQDATKTLLSKREDIYGSSKKILGQSLAVRILTHLLGDIHQPLHNSERVTPSKPQGDVGGNDFIIKHYQSKSMDNLHFIWDELFEDYSESIRTNLPKDKYLFIKTKGDAIMQEYPFSSLEAQIRANNTTQLWVQEGLQVAQTFVYLGITENEELPESYMAQARILCRERVALGGYRLGMLLGSIYDKLYKQQKHKRHSHHHSY
jgi:S1/P1 Nuclease